MSKRLQVIFDSVEYRELQQAARNARLTVSAFVRQSLRERRRSASIPAVATQLHAVREATRNRYVTRARKAESIDHTIVVQAASKSVVTVSPKCQVVIPRHIRESMGIAPGQKVQLFEYDGRIELMPVRPMSSYRGFLPGISTTVAREPDRF